MEIAIQVNGKLRGSVEVPVDTDKDEIINLSMKVENVQKFIEDLEVIKEIYVPNKLVNLVVK